MSDNTPQKKGVWVAIAMFVIAPQFYTVMPFYVGGLIDSLSLSSGEAAGLVSWELFAFAVASLFTFFALRWVSLLQMVLVASMLALLANIFSISMDGYNTSTQFLLSRLSAGFFIGITVACSVGMLANSGNVDRNFSLAVAGQFALAALLMFVVPHVSGMSMITIVLLIAVSASLLSAVISVQAILYKSLPQGKLLSTHGRFSWPGYRVALGLFGVAAFVAGQTIIFSFVERIALSAAMTPKLIGIVLGIASISSIVGAYAAGSVSEQYKKAGLIACSAAGMIITLLVIRSDINVIVFAISVIGFSAFFSFSLPIQLASIASADFSGASAVLIGLFQPAGAAIGPMLFSVFLSSKGLFAANMLSAGFISLGAILFFMMYRSNEKSAQTNYRGWEPGNR